jgi:hypothetical protein
VRLIARAASDRFRPMQSVRKPVLQQRLRPDAESVGGEVSRVMLHELEHPCPPTIIPKSGLNVCLWHKPDIPMRSADVRFWG